MWQPQAALPCLPKWQTLKWPKPPAPIFAQQLPMALGEKQITVTRVEGGVRMQAGKLERRAQYLLAALGRAPCLQGLEMALAGVRAG